MAEIAVEQVDVRKILPDENQPRKYFAADKMYQLKQSIKKHGIKLPLTIEDMGGGKYLLINGERRFRSAIEIGLKTVPCVIEAPKTESERLIEQFSVQEQSEPWTPIEKAMAILNLSKIVERPLVEVCKMLDVEPRTAARYVAFAELADKESFVKNEVPLDYAVHIRNLKNVTRALSQNVLEEEFGRDDEKKLEHQVTKLIFSGDIKRRSDLVKVADSFRKDPKLIEKFMTKENVTPTALFLEAKAQGTHHLRNALSSARSITSHIESFLKTKDVKLSVNNLEVLHRAESAIKKLIDMAE